MNQLAMIRLHAVLTSGGPVHRDQFVAMPRFLKSPAVQYLALFALIAVALFSALATPWAERLFVQPFTQLLVDICAAVLQPFDGRVQAQGNILRFSDGHGAVQVLAGCNAVEVCALLTAAILAFP